MMIRKIKHWIAHSIMPGKRYPLRLFGRRIVVYSGKWMDICFRKGVLVVIWRKKRRCVYFSPDGTPSQAKWGWGNFND